MLLHLDDRVKVCDRVVHRTLDAEAVLLHVDRGLYFGLDAIGTRVWEAVVEHGHARPVLAGLLDEFDVTPDTLAADVTRLLSDLAENGLIERQ
jgi:hypothetical protein